MSGKHTSYTVYVYQIDRDADISEDIKLAINSTIGTRGNVNRVVNNDIKTVQQMQTKNTD